MTRPMLVALLALSGVGCASDRTEVVLVVESDLAVPDEIDQVVVVVEGPDGRRQSASATLAAEPLPRTLGLVHEDGPLGPFLAHVEGQKDGTAVVARDARFHFQAERTLMLRVELLSSCVGISCGAEQTCDDNACRSVDVATSELRPWDPDAVGRDGGTFDAGMDGGVAVDAGDSGATDGGPLDAGPRDGGLRDAGPRDAGLRDAGGTDAGPRDAGGGDAAPGDAGCVPTGVEVCNGLDDDCDMMVDEDFNLNGDEQNCGRCGRVCEFLFGSGACMGGECVLASCQDGHGDCNDAGIDGCEINTMTNRGHCGACGNPCRGLQCCAGVCAPSC